MHAVGEAGLLLLLQLLAVFALLDPRAAVLAGRVGALLEGLISTDEVDAEAARLAGDGSGVTSHESVLSPSLDPAPLGRTAAVVRLRGDIGNRADLEAGGLQRPDRGLAARARALDEHVDLLHAVLLRLAGGVLGGQLRGERGRLARTLEADVTRRRPGDDVALRVGDRHDRVVERALDVCGAVRDVLLFPAAGLLALLGGSSLLPSLLVASGYLAFFLPAMVRFGPLRVRALVLVRWPRTGRPRRCRRPW